MTDVISKKERLLLEYALSNKELFIKAYSILEPEYFDMPLNTVVKYSKDYFSQYHNLPDFDILEAETGVMFVEREVAQDEFDYVTDQIEQHCKNEAMRLAIVNSVDELEEGNFSAIEQKVRDALMVSITKDMGTDLFADPELRLMMMQQDVDSRTIGWNSIDAILDFVRRGEMVLFAAGSGGGKSVALANVGNNMAQQGLHVLYVSLELREDLIGKRMDSIISGIAGRDIFDNVEDVVKAYDKVKDDYGTYFIKRLPASSTSASNLRAYLLEYNIQFGRTPDVLLVDYLDLLAPNDRKAHNGRFEEDKAVSEELREIFMEFNMFGFTASQLNRDAIDSAIKSQAHIAGGLSKINTSDAAIALSRTQEQIDNGEIEFQPIKLRNAEMVVNPITMYFDPKSLRISESPNLAAKMQANTTTTTSSVTNSPQEKLKKLLNNNKTGKK